MRCKVIIGGTIKTGKGINLPYTNVSLPALTPKDEADVRFGISAGVDYIALSFVRHADDVLKLKRLIARLKADTPVIVKLEKPEALEHLDAVIAAADGVLVARGDLAVELSLAKVPAVQKRIVALANEQNKISIVATQMLETMMENPFPTRAEASDVANAVFDGADAVMLSGETASGKYPVAAVRTMAEIVREAERVVHANHTDDQKHAHAASSIDGVREMICYAASSISYHLREQAMLVFSRHGDTAKLLSKYRPESCVYAVTIDEAVYRRMAFYRGVCPVLLPKEAYRNAETSAIAALVKRRYLSKGRDVIILTGIHDARGWHTNALSVRRV